MAISISATPSVLVEEEGTLLTLTISSDEPIPEGGLVLTVSSETVNALGQFDVLAAQPDNVQILGVTDDTNGFRVRLNEQTGAITLPVFDDSDEDSPLDLTFSVEPGEGYTVDESTGSVTLTIEDAEGGMTTPPDETPDETPGTGLPLVSLNTGPDYLVEADGTVSAHVFNVTEGTIPSGGLLVGVKAPSLSEFDLDGISVGDGGKIVNVREDGFDIRLTDFTVLVDLPVAADGVAEGLETASFSLEAGDGYEVNDDFGSGSFEIVDTAEEVPNNFSEPNDILPLAQEIRLSPENPEVKITETAEFDIGNRYQNDDGSFTYVDANEDVDFYKFDLKAGDIISIKNDSLVKGNPDIADFPGLDFNNSRLGILRIFDDEGSEIATDQQSSAPGELFTSGFDGYLEFEAPESGTYYLGSSTFINGASQRFALPEYYGELTYDPFVPASGDGDTYGVTAPNFGEYELTFTLNPENLVYLANQRNQSSKNSPETIDLAQAGEPTVSLNFSTATFASAEDPRVISGELNEDDLINSNVIEGYPVPGSALNLVLTTQGDIPQEGIFVNIDSNGYLRDYFSNRSLLLPPFTPGSELVDIITDDTGRETGFQLRITEPATFITLSARTPYWAELLEPGTNGLEFQPETDGPEEVTFFLEGGEGYGVSETANQVTPTFYDSSEQAPEPSIIPEVSLTISETKLTESEGTETTLNFSLSEAPSEEGVLVYVKGAAGILPQFDVLNGEVTGGVYPTANGDTSGFYFKITEPEASITLTPFADPFDEGLQSYSLALQETPLYTIDNDASEVNFTIADNPDSVLEVSLNSDSVAIESDDTVGLLTFNLTANPPESGVEVRVNASNLSEFDTEVFTVTGGEITEITDTGFSLNITDATATMQLPPLSDGEAEGIETATFSLVESADYLINPDALQATVTVVDIPEEVPSPTEEFASNDTISEAVDLNINPFNPTAKFTAALNSREPSDFAKPAFGVNEISEATEDVDFYSFNLKAGDTIKLDIDAIPAEFERYAGVELKLDSELRLFDADGNELASVNNGAAPDEEFSRDPYLEFTASEAGTYYAGVSQLGNTNYNPLVETNESVGSGWIFPEIGVYFGSYELNVELVSDGDGSKPTAEPVFGSLEADIIEVTGTSQLFFGGNSDDLIDASIGSQGGNRVYAGSGDDTLILGNGDRLVGGEGADKFFTTSGGDNIITGGAGADQFWIATAETPDAANIITDFTSGEDVLGIAGLGIGFDDLSITQQDDNTLIAANGSDLAILQGVGADSLIADNFAFA